MKTDYESPVRMGATPLVDKGDFSSMLKLDTGDGIRIYEKSGDEYHIRSILDPETGLIRESFV